MPAKKQYADPAYYESKLAKVMARLDASEYDWDYNRHGGWVRFVYKGQAYLFEHTVENARNHGVKLDYGSDAFAQIVLALEDLCRIVDRGIYDLQNWVAGMRALPQATPIPACFVKLGFDHIPTTEQEVKKAYRNKIQTAHPDVGGDVEEFRAIDEAYDEALRYLKGE